ncbi:unnamed protein product, partial [Dibothriocephalus latus]
PFTKGNGLSFEVRARLRYVNTVTFAVKPAQPFIPVFVSKAALPINQDINCSQIEKAHSDDRLERAEYEHERKRTKENFGQAVKDNRHHISWLHQSDGRIEVVESIS